MHIKMIRGRAGVKGARVSIRNMEAVVANQMNRMNGYVRQSNIHTFK